MLITGLLSMDKHLKIVREATWEIRSKWYDLGTELEIKDGTLQVSFVPMYIQYKNSCHDPYLLLMQAINDNNLHSRNFVNICFTALLETWLTQTPPPTVNSLIEALKSPVIDRGDIARNIEGMLGK